MQVTRTLALAIRDIIMFKGHMKNTQFFQKLFTVLSADYKAQTSSQNVREYRHRRFSFFRRASLIQAGPDLVRMAGFFKGLSHDKYTHPL